MSSPVKKSRMSEMNSKSLSPSSLASPSSPPSFSWQTSHPSPAQELAEAGGESVPYSDLEMSNTSKDISQAK